MADRSDFETADRLARRRARIWPVLAIFFIAQQTAYFSHAGAGDRTVDHFRISAWIACSIVRALRRRPRGSQSEPRSSSRIAPRMRWAA